MATGVVCTGMLGVIHCSLTGVVNDSGISRLAASAFGVVSAGFGLKGKEWVIGIWVALQ